MKLKLRFLRSIDEKIEERRKYGSALVSRSDLFAIEEKIEVFNREV